MNSMIEDVNHLSREIGARPAGTEEERLAAMYIAENIQKRSGLPFDIEDFEGAKGRDRVFNVLSIVSAVILFVAVLLSATTIPAFILTLIIAVLLILEYFDKPFLSNFFRFGISQNVVAKYTPAYSSSSQQVQRKRKVVIVSHYDSGKSLPPNNSFYKLGAYIKIIDLVLICIIPLFLLVKMLAFAETSGAATLFCVIFSLILIIVSLLPMAFDIYQSRLLYNEGANCNASANAVLIELARQLGTGSYSTDDDYVNKPSTPRSNVHGKDAAIAAGLVPDDAKIEYQVDNTFENNQTKEMDALEQKEESLASAKAAVEAFTSPRKPRVQYDDEGNAVNQDIVEPKAKDDKPSINAITIDDAAAARTEIKADTTASIPAYKTENKSSGEVPDWFKSAQSKAKKAEKDDDEGVNVGQRSRFAHTMDYMASRQEEEERKKQEEEEEKRAKLRAQIEAANKAAEEERKKKFAEKEKPFVKEDANKEAQSEEAKSENLTIDESFKKHQQENKAPKKIEMPPEKKEETKNEVKEEVNEEPEDKNSPTLLPEHSGPIKLDEIKQYAPLDDDAFISSNQMPENSALTELPEVFTGEENIENNPEYAKALKEDDKTNDKYSTGELEKGKFGTGSFAAVSQNEGMAGATGTFAPVKEELIEDASRSGEIGSKEEMVVADADDSVYSEGEFTDTGAFAGKGYVDMPEEKSKGLFSRFGRKNKSGKHANLGNDNADSAGSIVDDDDIIEDADWEGGAFSNIADKLPLKKNKQEEAPVENEEYFEDQANEAEYVPNVEYDEKAPITSDASRISSMVDAVPDFEEQIQNFRNTSINVEVWLVALGSELGENSGTKAFLLEHAQELRGAIIIDIEGLGAGDISLVNSEGIIRRTTAASRLKRYVRQAANKLNMTIPSVDIPWGESSAHYAQKHGFKTLKLVGMDGDKPAYYMDSEDVVENIDESKLKQNAKYLIELIQTI